MSLPACQQRALESIEIVLQRREPRLASMFAMFTRLAWGEGMPRTERLEKLRWWAWRRRRQHGYAGPPTAAVRMLLLLPLAAMAIAAAVFLGITGSRPPCTPGTGPHGPVATSLGRARTCASVSGAQYPGRP